MLTRWFDGQSVLLVRALLSGTGGARRALEVFRRQQRANPQMSLLNFMETLCRDEIACPQPGAQHLTVKPLVCLFSALFKQNLLTFIHLIHSALPRIAVLRVLECLSQDSYPSPWVTALIRQLERNFGIQSEDRLFTSMCSNRLEELSRRVVGFGENGGWLECLSVGAGESDCPRGPSEVGTQRKRRCSHVSLDSDEGTAQPSKRKKLDPCDRRCTDVEDQRPNEELIGMEGDAPLTQPAEEPQPETVTSCDALPERIKVAALQIKELLDSQTEWDQNSTDLFKVLNDCEPSEVEMLCRVLSLPDLPEQVLPKLCNSVLALSPDLSYSTAATFIKSLLLQKVLSLSEPAPRCLVTSATSLCSRYTRPMCHAVIGPVLEDTDMGNPQAELLNRLIEGCLDSHYRLLVLQMAFKVPWSEAVLSILHSLLDSKPDLNEELFTQLIQQLVNKGSQFTKSVKFAKMLLTILTKYRSLVTAAHKHSMSSCLMSNETFLKKSLQAALKRITDA